jgi:hypothetical protein
MKMRSAYETLLLEATIGYSRSECSQSTEQRWVVSDAR